MAVTLSSSNLISSSTPRYQNPNFKPKPLLLLRLPLCSSPQPISTFNLSLCATNSRKLGFYISPKCSNDRYYNSIYDNDDDDENRQNGRVVYPRPSEIPWNKELCNSVNLIGIVGAPVQIKHLASGKVFAWTRIGVKKSASDTIWINLTFWNELAHVASQHVEKGQRIYISGRLESNTVEGDDEKSQTYYKVVVQQLNFVERSFSPISLFEHEKNSMPSGGRLGNNALKNVSSTQELWQAFFANPVDWWDNRKNKRNAKYPDFKHKHTGESLWVEGKYNPSWVKSQLAILDSRMESLPVNEAVAPVAYVSGDDATIF